MAKNTTASAKSNTALKKKDSAEVAAATSAAAESWGDDHVDSGDILIPKLFVLNPMSVLCIENPEDFRSGDLVRSTDKKVLGNTKEGVAFIPIADTKVWKISKSTGSKFEFVRFEDYNRSNADLPWNWEEGGVQWRRDTTVNMFCLLPADILREQEAIADFEKTGDLPDPDDVMLPCCISFSRTSYAAGKVLLSHKAKCVSMRMNMAVKTFMLKSRMETNDDNKYYVLDVSPLEKTNVEFMAACKKWYLTIKETNVQMDEENEEAASGAGSKPAASASKREQANTVSDQF